MIHPSKMQNGISTLLLSTLVFVILVLGNAPSAARAAKPPLRVFLLTGQINMIGLGVLALLGFHHRE